MNLTNGIIDESNRDFWDRIRAAEKLQRDAQLREVFKAGYYSWRRRSSPEREDQAWRRYCFDAVAMAPNR